MYCLLSCGNIGEKPCSACSRRLRCTDITRARSCRHHLHAVTRDRPAVSGYNLSERTFVTQKRFVEPFQRLMDRRCRERKVMQARQFVLNPSMTQFALSSSAMSWTCSGKIFRLGEVFGRRFFSCRPANPRS